MPFTSKSELISKKFIESHNQIIIRIYKNTKLKESSDNQSLFDNCETENTEYIKKKI
jgi:hypothetical protein